MKPDPERVKAILDIEIPSNKKELKSILGMFNYLRKFVPNMSSITAPLRELLKHNVEFQSLPKHTEALNDLKCKISNALTLGTFDGNKEITLQCDSCKNGMGCCLLQNGQPIAFASRRLNDAQIEKEFLSIVFATKKFHNYIYGSLEFHVDDDIDVSSDNNCTLKSDVTSNQESKNSPHFVTRYGRVVKPPDRLQVS